MSTSTATSSAIFTLVNHPTRHHHPRASHRTCIPPNFTPKLNPRLRISRKSTVLSNQGYCVPVQFCCNGSGNAGISSEIVDDSSKVGAWSRELKTVMLARF
ncbi:hypothetical protein RND81_04G063000 [Saponaria officinalis]|uniref:Uncharacterized protein n=1 Tax=Saponaria officinalis TaxID=3572 RepID=A0AAW1LD29_SAPOF